MGLWIAGLMVEGFGAVQIYVRALRLSEGDGVRAQGYPPQALTKGLGFRAPRCLTVQRGRSTQ